MSSTEIAHRNVKTTREGTLGGWKNFKPHGRGRTSITSLILDIADPQYYPPTFALLGGEEVTPNRHEQVYAIHGKAAESLSLDDVGRPIRVTGWLKMNPSSDRYGTFTRATVEFLDG